MLDPRQAAKRRSRAFGARVVNAYMDRVLTAAEQDAVLTERLLRPLPD